MLIKIGGFRMEAAQMGTGDPADIMTGNGGLGGQPNHDGTCHLFGGIVGLAFRAADRQASGADAA